MLNAILTSLAVVAALVFVAACITGWVAMARATAINAARLLSTEVKALPPEGRASEGEARAQAVERLKRTFAKSLLVAFIAFATCLVITALRNLILTGDWRG